MWSGHVIERNLLVLVARQRFRGEARALADEAAELRALAQGLGPNAPLVDSAELQAMVDELAGSRPANMSHQTGPLAQEHALVVGGHARPWPPPTPFYGD